MIIIAPHADDEIIGMFTMLQLRRRPMEEDPVLIIYLEEGFEGNDERKGEAARFCKMNGFQFLSCSVEHLWGHLEARPKNGRVWFPDPDYEEHPLHKDAGGVSRAACRHMPTRYGTYSTCMSSPYVRVLSRELQSEKRRALNRYYDSQKMLWESNYKYFLFEAQAEVVV